MTDPRTERDRTLRRVRGTTAAAGVGAVVVTGTLAGLLGHAASTDTQAATPASTSTGSTGSTGTDSTDSTATDGLATPTASPTTDTSSGDDQPSVVTGGS